MEGRQVAQALAFGYCSNSTKAHAGAIALRLPKAEVSCGGEVVCISYLGGAVCAVGDAVLSMVPVGVTVGSWCQRRKQLENLRLGRSAGAWRG